LNGDEDGKPLLYFFSTCRHTIRTVPALQHDANRPEDVMTQSEDHAGDETRYACMSRPYIPKIATQSSKEDRWSKAFARAGGGDASKWKTA
jgi:hypothetical protein